MLSLSRILIGLFVILAIPIHAYAIEVDLSSPEAALASSVRSLNQRDLVSLNACLLVPVKTFSFSERGQITRCAIERRFVYGEQETNDWNAKGIIPPAAFGDIEFHMRMYIDGKPFMYSFNFRKVLNEWKIVDFVAWDN